MLAKLLDYDPDDLDVQVADLLVATPDGADPLLDPAVQEVLGIIREKVGMDVVFVSQFADGRRTMRVVDVSEPPPVVKPGDSDPLEESWCQRVVDGRLPEFMPDAKPYIEKGVAPRPPFPIGTHISTPVWMKNGDVFGTLCCFSFRNAPHATDNDLKRLKFTANLLAAKLDAASVCQALGAKAARPAASTQVR